MSLNRELAARFKTMATVLQLLGESGFKVNANLKVADVLDQLVEDVSTIDDATSIDGIGKGSATKIKEYIETGKMADYDALIEQIPSGLLDVLKVQGLGPKTVQRLWKEANVVDLTTLQEAIDDGRLLALPRMGQKTIDNIKDSLEFIQSSSGRTNIGVAIPIAESLVSQLSNLQGVTQCEFAGSLRRGCETIGDIDILLSTSEPETAIEYFCSMPNVTKVLVAGDTKCSVRIEEGMQCDLRVIDEEQYGAALLYFTGSKSHNVFMREVAIKQGRRLNEYGLFKDDSKDSTPPQSRGIEPIAAQCEDSIYEALNLAWTPPELREENSLDGDGIPSLITASDVKCDLHCHTTASDGTMSIEELAEEGIKRGYHTIAVTDHSQTQAQANGLSPERLVKHIKAIRNVNEQYSEITVLAGSEVDILPDGTLDYEDALLEALDIVVASPHAALKQNPDEATARLCKAIEHPNVHIIGHPTGRIIQKRAGLEPDMIQLFEAAVKHNTALELNAHSLRLDLRDWHIRSAVKHGVSIAINTDAHRPTDFEQLRFGIATARRGGLEPKSCINCFNANELSKWLNQKR